MYLYEPQQVFMPLPQQAARPKQRPPSRMMESSQYVVVIKFDLVSAVLLSAAIVFAALAMCQRR
jgi:hypothetical protein